MSQGKTEFKFRVNADITVVESLIRNWLNANGFSFQPKPGANYYAFNDPMLKGKRGLEYYINGNEVTILAYLGTYEKHQDLEGFVGALPKQAYRNELNPLFEELKKLESGRTPNMANAAPNAQGNMPNPGYPAGQGYPNGQPAGAGQGYPGGQPAGAGQGYPNGQPAGAGQMQDDSLNRFTEKNNKNKEKMAIAGFILSLVGLVVICLGASYGSILIVMEYYFAIQGLKTKKKGLAIATIVLASINLVVLIGSIILSAMM